MSVRRMALVAALSLVPLGVVTAVLYQNLQEARRMETMKQVASLAKAVSLKTLFDDQRPLDLPRGSIRDLYMWLKDQPEGRECGRGFGFRPLVDATSCTFRDMWGNELVYSFPPRRRVVIFQLYSLGPNGRDEGGEGDDVTCGEMADFQTWRYAFKGGSVDPVWVWDNIGRLVRDCADGTITMAGSAGGRVR